MRLAKYCFPLLLLSLPSLLFATVEDTFDRIKKNPVALYAFLKKMPKGGELHFHLAGSAYPETMLAVAAKGGYCLNPHTFVMSGGTQPCKGIKAEEVAANPVLYNQTIRAWSMKDFIPGVESGHDHFFAAFPKFVDFVAENKIPLLAGVMQRAVNQHEQYMEIILPDYGDSATVAGAPIPVKDYNPLKQQWLHDQAFVSDIEKTIASADSLLPQTRNYLGCDRSPEQDVCRLSVRFQYQVLREQPLERLFPQALKAFAAASGSHAIVGVNLVQPEDGILSLRDYREQMKIFEFLHQAYPNVLISLHAGELTQNDVPPEALRFHIHDAVKIGHAQRIGHGVDIGFENKAMELAEYMASHQIAVEINLSSNLAILNISGKKHPLRFYLEKRVPLVLSTDDEGILRTDLTSQYLQAVLKQGVDYTELKHMNRNSLTFSFLPGESIWADPEKAVRVAACRELQSAGCQDFIAHSEKAALQWKLELKLLEFEKQESIASALSSLS